MSTFLWKPKMLMRHNINLKFFCDMGVPILGGGGGVWQRGKNSHVKSFFLECLPKYFSLTWTGHWKCVSWFVNFPPSSLRSHIFSLVSLKPHLFISLPGRLVQGPRIRRKFRAFPGQASTSVRLCKNCFCVFGALFGLFKDIFWGEIWSIPRQRSTCVVM